MQIIARKVQPWFLDQDHDNFVSVAVNRVTSTCSYRSTISQICLVDKDSGLFFWFNCKDESSQWADTEGEGWAGYGSRRASTMNPDTVYSNALSSSKSGLLIVPTSPPRSPRAPTAADEKEADAASAATDTAAESKLESPDSEPKKRGIADVEDKEGGSAKESFADAKEDVAPTVVRSESKLDSASSAKEQGDLVKEASARISSTVDASSDSTAADVNTGADVIRPEEVAPLAVSTESVQSTKSPLASPNRASSVKVTDENTAPSQKITASTKEPAVPISPRPTSTSDKTKIVEPESAKVPAPSYKEASEDESLTAAPSMEVAAE